MIRTSNSLYIYIGFNTSELLEVNKYIDCAKIRNFKKLMDIHSVSFKEIYEKVFFRLELIQFIHVFFTESKEILINLPRLGLNFKIDGEKIISYEYESKCVSFDQSIQTLFGLEQGLIMQDNIDQCCHLPIEIKKFIIIPHGIVSTNAVLNIY